MFVPDTPVNRGRKNDDLRIEHADELLAPMQIMREKLASETAIQTTVNARAAIQNILNKEDDRLFVVVGPCSIHDSKAALEYAERLAKATTLFADDLLLVMRVYFEKPRTTVGWKGFLNDPHLDESYDINEGIRLARQLLIDINELGVPAGTEYLDLITPQYISDLVSWAAIGARTTESQSHRQLASGLSFPVGFKNGTDGRVKIAIDALHAASVSHHFISITKTGQAAVFRTSGNDDCHVILRGGIQPNYDAASVHSACKTLGKAGLPQRVMVDCSHANSGKDYTKQLDVAKALNKQLAEGSTCIVGAMVESHLNPGRQDLNGEPLQYGVSITDACLGWDQTIEVLETLAEGVRQRRKS